MRAHATSGQRRGMTMLEVLLASVLLAMLASALAGAVVFAQRSEMMRVKRLMAYDVANRLILQYVDDRYNKSFPKMSDPVRHEGLDFFFDLVEEPVEMVNLDGEIPGQAEGMRLIRVRVYSSTQPWAGNVQRGEQLAELVRPYHPLVAMYRNNDSMGRMLKNMEFINQLQKLAPGSSGRTGGVR